LPTLDHILRLLLSRWQVVGVGGRSPSSPLVF